VSSQQSTADPVAELVAARRALLAARLKGHPRATALVPRARRGDVPLSFAQERLYFLAQLEPESAAYNVYSGLRLPGRLDVSALERALGEVVRRHEALRTVFQERDGVPVQVVQPFAAFHLPVEDLSGLPPDEREAAVTRRAAEASRPFDLATGPLFRATLLRVGAEDHVLLVCMHHIVSDGWSMKVLTREVRTASAAFRDGMPSPLPELPLQYADYAVWQREQEAGGALARQLEYWKRQLAGAPELLELPTDHPRPPAPSYRGDTVPVSLPAVTLESLHELARAESATLFMVVLAAFQVMLAKYAGSADVVVGTPIAGRTHPELEGLIGFFVNTLVLRTDLSGDPGFREVLRRAREAMLSAYENQEVPFEKLVAELQPERSLSHSPLFQVMLVMDSADTVDAGEGSAKFDLTLGLGTTASGLQGGLQYSTDLFERGTAERMVRHLGRVLEQAVANADVRLSALELLDAAERATVLEEWNRTEAPFPSDACIHQLFEAQAARTPDAAALVHEAETITYGALNERANRIAHHLARRGVGSEARVGICLERGIEMVAAIFGVLKAGGAYVPLDPAYPAERLAFMLADSAAAVLLTQESLRGVLPARDGLQVISLDAAWHEIEAEPVENPGRGAGPSNLAYLIYTSGSTGVPKGVAIEHRNTAALLGWAWSKMVRATDVETTGVASVEETKNQSAAIQNGAVQNQGE